MLFELTNTPATFQRLMNYILHNYLNNFVVVYLNDILICSDIFEEYLVHLRKVFIKLQEANLVIKLKKCKFKQRKIKFLEHTIGTDRLRTNSENIEKIINYPVFIKDSPIITFKFYLSCNLIVSLINLIVP